LCGERAMFLVSLERHFWVVSICRGVPPWRAHFAELAFNLKKGAPTEGRPYRLGHYPFCLCLLQVLMFEA